jgi:hypothetical protein
LPFPGCGKQHETSRINYPLSFDLDRSEKALEAISIREGKSLNSKNKLVAKF